MFTRSGESESPNEGACLRYTGFKTSLHCLNQQEVGGGGGAVPPLQTGCSDDRIEQQSHALKQAGTAEKSGGVGGAALHVQNARMMGFKTNHML